MSINTPGVHFEQKFELRSPISGKFKNAKMLNFDDVEDEDGGRYNRCLRSRRPGNVDCSPSNAALWDSGLGSPTPGSSPKSTLGGASSTQRRCARCHSPIPFSTLDDESGDEESPFPRASLPPAPPDTPPHRRLRRLRLNDTPHTPKSLLEKSQRRVIAAGHSYANTDLVPESASCKNGRVTPRLVLDPTRPQTNVNPFATCRKRTRREVDDSLSEESPAEDAEDEKPSSKRLALSEINTSRYVEEFHQISKLGDGEFGSVYKCVNRLDGCTYAIKKSKMPVAGSIYERTALNEVYAHAVLGKHTHVVRYYSAWAENFHMYIQNEFCNGGNLGDVISENRRKAAGLGIDDLAQILMQVSQGLKYIHAQGLVHLDIKPANVFIHHEPVDSAVVESGLEDEISDVEEMEVQQKIIYKIGDLGHVTASTSPVVEEGDCRYLPLEVLQESYTDLAKADIFSLALTIYEAGSSVDLPKNGPFWHEIREVTLPDISHVTTEFNSLLKLMAHLDPKLRPSASSLTHHSILCPFRRKSRAQLCRELNEEKMKNQLLSRELVEFQKTAANVGRQTQLSSAGGMKRLLGRSCTRSMSLTVF